MKKRILLFATGLGLLFFTTSVSAASFNFLDEANSQERGYSYYTLTVDGLTVTATGTKAGDTDGINDYFAYLDSGNAGLGVCRELTASNQCTPSSDDNVTNGEMLTLSFDSVVTISNYTLRNANHGTNFASDADYWFSIDGGAFSWNQMIHNNNVSLTGSVFSFVVADLIGGLWVSDPDEFYISTLTAAAPVPEPSTLLLLGAGLCGLGFFRTRKNLKSRSLAI